MGDADKFPIIRDKGRYRIQSVDFETFLERRGADILLRPLKKTSTNQEWVFAKKSDHVYEILPAEKQNWILAGEKNSSGTSLGLEETPIQIIQGTTIGTTWKPYTASPFTDHVYIISDEFRERKTKNYLVYVDDTEVTFASDSQVKPDQNFHTLDKGEHYLWRLIEVTPASLPDGDSNGQYRIRTLNGMVIHSLPNQEKLSVKNQTAGNHRAWIIDDLGNGNCTLKNVGTNKYLATKRISDNWEPVLGDSPPVALTSTGSTPVEEKERSPWRIEVISEFHWSICIWRRTNRAHFQGKEKLSLSLKDDTIILKPWKKAHNQIWMIEPTDARRPADSKPNPGDDEILPGSSIKPNKPYQLFRHDKLGGIRVAYNKTELQVSLSLDPNYDPSQLLIERNPAGELGDVYISRSLNGKNYLNVTASKISVGTDPYSWTVEQAQSKDFFLYVKFIDLPFTSHLPDLKIKNPRHQVKALSLTYRTIRLAFHEDAV